MTALALGPRLTPLGPVSVAPAASTRLAFIDCARTFAVLLALLSHGLSTTGSFEHLEAGGFDPRHLTRTATPLFVFMFGFMVEDRVRTASGRRP